MIGCIGFCWMRRHYLEICNTILLSAEETGKSRNMSDGERKHAHNADIGLM